MSHLGACWSASSLDRKWLPACVTGLFFVPRRCIRRGAFITCLASCRLRYEDPAKRVQLNYYEYIEYNSAPPPHCNRKIVAVTNGRVCRNIGRIQKTSQRTAHPPRFWCRACPSATHLPTVNSRLDTLKRTQLAHTRQGYCTIHKFI